MTSTPTSERRRFGMHANLLYDVITKQAGTLQKAILEGVMNGVDAGASRIEVALTEKTLTIVDDGKGFKDRSEIENFFETFGTPHQEGDATYGRFRMGRGQLFAFGSNRWRTNVFQMDVDIKSKGLDYDLQEQAKPTKGCRIDIELYKHLLPSERDSIERELRQWVAYVSVPVKLNGKVISQDPASCKWDVETDQAWFKLASSKATLSVYNLGVLVMNAPASRYGTGGTVVSKHRLDVNFARNDVQSDCPIFSAIRAELRKHSDKNVVSKKRMTDQERQHLAERFLEKTVSYKEAMEFPVITGIEGPNYSLGRLYQLLWSDPVVVCAPRGNRAAVKINQQGLAVVIAQETIERFNVSSSKELFALLRETCLDYAKSVGYPAADFAEKLQRATHKTVADFADYVSDNYDPIPNRQLKPNQRTLLRAIEAAMWPIAAQTGQPRRQLHAGHSDVADAWTDGTRNVWINVRNLSLVREGFQGCARIAALLVHEFMHEGPDTNTHDHDVEFYTRYHDMVIDSGVIGAAVKSIMTYLALDARRQGRKPSPTVGWFEDMEERIVRAGGTGSRTVGDIAALVDAADDEDRADPPTEDAPDQVHDASEDPIPEEPVKMAARRQAARPAPAADQLSLI